MYIGHRYPLRSRRGMITHFVISTQTLNSSSTQKGEKAIEISASVFPSLIRVLMSPDSAIAGTKRQRAVSCEATAPVMTGLASPGIASATHEGQSDSDPPSPSYHGHYDN